MGMKVHISKTGFLRSKKHEPLWVGFSKAMLRRRRMGKREQRKGKETEIVTERGRLRWSVMLERGTWPLLLHLLSLLLLSKLRFGSLSPSSFLLSF